MTAGFSVIIRHHLIVTDSSNVIHVTSNGMYGIQAVSDHQNGGGEALR